MSVSDSVMIIDRGMSKKKRIELKTELCLCSVKTSSHSALFPAQYTPISMVNDTTHDNDTMMVSLLRYPMHSIGVSP